MTTRRHRFQRPRQSQSVSSDASNSSHSSSNEDDPSPPQTRRGRVKSTPRTKRRSITRLNELVRRQKDEFKDERVSLDSSELASRIDQNMESMLHDEQAPATVNATATATERLIQVALRCRPRQSSQVRHRSGEDGSSESESETETEMEPRPKDGVVEYDFDDAPASSRRKALPAVSVPSQVLALGGHGSRRRFEFDCVLPPWIQQRDVYAATARDAIECVLSTVHAQAESADEGGHVPQSAHATFVAYGQTGTGKTYTMGMLQRAEIDESEHGIIPRALVHILSRISDYNCSSTSRQSGIRLAASMSFLQIYLESIQDLLVAVGPSTQTAPQQAGGRRPTIHNSSAGAGLPVRLNPATNEFYVAGLSEFPIKDIAEARSLLELAAHNRILASTVRNKTSSRSHTLLTICIKPQRQQRECSGGPAEPCCTVSFVDLAGSERVEGALHFLHATRKHQELRIREAKFINRSLSALGSVIAALATQENRRTKLLQPRKVTPSPTRRHIRFRDSQLTKLLQSRLMNGNGRLVLIATIDDRPANLAETLSTLKFASQCRRVDLNQNRATSEAARKRREETALKQVVAGVAAMYEEREAALHKQYEARITALNERVRSIQEQQELPRAREREQRSALHHDAAYVALRSLADIAWRKDGSPVAPPPRVESIGEDCTTVHGIAELYHRIKGALVRGDQAPAVASDGSDQTARLLRAQQRRASQRKSSQPKRQPVGVDGEADTTACPTAYSILRPGANNSVGDSEFDAIAHHLTTSGMLECLVVSSDEDDMDDSYSQLK